MIPRFSRRLNRESTERLGLDFRDHRIDVDSADGSTERALKDELPNLPAYRVDLDSADGSTERALKEHHGRADGQQNRDSADGSTERALKVLKASEDEQSWVEIQQTAQQREH